MKALDTIDLDRDLYLALEKAWYESDSSQDILFATISLKEKDENFPDDVITNALKLSAEKLAEYNKVKDRITNEIIPEQYRDDRYRWEYDSTRKRLIITENKKTEEEK